MNKNTFWVLLITLLLGLMFYGEAQYSFPTLDDQTYAFKSLPEYDGDIYQVMKEGVRREKIQSLQDAIESQQLFYQKTNGRFLVHTVVQYLSATCNFLHYEWLNTLMYMCLVLLLLRLCIPLPLTLPKAIVALFSFFALIPYKGLTFWLGMAASVNYLWTAVFFFLLYLLYEKKISQDTKLPTWQYPLLFLFSAVVGSLQESFMIGFSGGIFLYYLFHRRKITLPVAIFSIGLFIGTAFVVFAPGNFKRLDGNGMGIQWNFLARSAMTPIILLCVLLLLYVFIRQRTLFYRFVRQQAVLFLILLVNSLFALFIAYNGRHQMTCISLLSLVLFLRLIFQLKWSSMWKRISCAMMALLLVLIYPTTLLARRNYGLAMQHYREKVAVQKDNVIVDEAYTSATQHLLSQPLLLHNYASVFDFGRMSGLRNALSLELSHGKSIHWGEKCWPMSFEKITSYCTPTHQVQPQIYQLPYGYYVGVYPQSLTATEIQQQFEPNHYTCLQQHKYQGSWYYLLIKK